MNGILLVDKPEEITSAEVVRRVKRRLRTKTGHLGTLDPFASGLLPLCLGEATKIAPFLNTADKAYEGTIALGARTDTGDRTGATVETAVVPGVPEPGELDRIAASHLGHQLQVPPMYSALKRDGRPLYTLARKGITVEREPRAIDITSLALRCEAPSALGFEVACSKGTYVRVLAEDIARSFGTVGHLSRLRRTRFGSFSIAAALGLDEIDTRAEHALIPPAHALPELPDLALTRHDEARARQGFQPLLARLPLPHERGAVKLLGTAGDLVAIVTVDAAGERHYARVFAAPS